MKAVLVLFRRDLKFSMSNFLGSLKLGSIQWFVVKKTNERVITVSAEEEEIRKAKV